MTRNSNARAWITGNNVEWHRWPNWKAFEEKLPANARLWFVESGGPKIYTEVKFSADDYLVFGREDRRFAETVAGTKP